jgi:short-subunit dehydrogenase
VPILDSTTIVTGASGGIGRAVALDLAAAGAHVIAVARTESKLDQLVEEADGAITAFPADLSDQHERERLVASVGPVDVLVNNAGLAWLGDVVDIPVDDLHAVVALNLLAPIDLTRRLLPGMIERRSGHVVNIGSVLGYASLPPLVVYSATKAGIGAFTDGLRREVTGTGVDVTLITPGAVNRTGAIDAAGGADDGAPLSVAFEWTGVSPERVATAVRDALEHPGWPGYRSFSVPRTVGLSRAAASPVGGFVMDGGLSLVRRLAGRLH